MDCRDHLLQTVDPLVEQRALTPQVRQRVHGRIVEEGRDLLEREAELAVQQYPMQTFDVGAGVVAVAGTAARARPEQADLVVVVQRPHAHSDQLGDLADRASSFPVVHVHHRAASRHVRVKPAPQATGG